MTTTHPAELLTNGLTPFTAEEVKRLQRYRRRVKDLNQNEIATRQAITLNIAGNGRDLLDGVTLEQIKALATDIRPLGWNNSDPGHATFNEIRGLIGQHAHTAGTPESEHLKTWLRTVKSDRRTAMKYLPFMGWSIEHDDGQTTAMTPEFILQAAFNGAVFHDDDDDRAAFDALGGWDSGLLRTHIVTAMWELAAIFTELDTLVADILTIPSLNPTA